MINRNFQLEVSFLLYIYLLKVYSADVATSNLWKLNSERTKIIEVSAVQVMSDPFLLENDHVFNIITSTVGPAWVKEQVEYYCIDCHEFRRLKVSNFILESTQTEEELHCGKPVNFTFYDNLVGVLNRKKHPDILEPQPLFVVTKKSKIEKEININNLEWKLRKAKKEKPKSVQLFNQIGNFWHIKGDARKAIECFRRVLAASPHNAEALLNLARLLFTLQYLDDAMFLTRRSLEVSSSNKGTWQQYFTLGEILKTYGRYQEASIHLKHALVLRPDFEAAQNALKEIENMPTTNVHTYTLLIIICLVLGVLLVTLTSVENILDADYPDTKSLTYFNKTAPTRSVRGLGMNQKHRAKKILA